MGMSCDRCVLHARSLDAQQLLGPGCFTSGLFERSGCSRCVVKLLSASPGYCAAWSHGQAEAWLSPLPDAPRSRQRARREFKLRIGHNALRRPIEKRRACDLFFDVLLHAWWARDLSAAQLYR